MTAFRWGVLLGIGATLVGEMLTGMLIGVIVDILTRRIGWRMGL